MSNLRSWIVDRVGLVQLRQFADRLRHRLSFVPLVYVVVGIIASQLLLLVDRRIGERDIPEFLATTVDSARSVFTVIAGGLITSITLLLSMMLVTIQLASSQFSPRTLREWLSDRWLQNTIGLALGTTVFCLLALRSTRSFGEEGVTVVPHTTVIVAVALGVAALVAVVQTVDHVTHGLRIGAVADRIAAETIGVIRERSELRAGQGADIVPATPTTHTDTHDTDTDTTVDTTLPDDAAPIEATRSGWVQQIDVQTLVRAVPDGSTGIIVVPLGSYVVADAPIMWVTPAPPDGHECFEQLHNGFALGDTRTMQQDIAFGLVQLTDIAVRALSPGVNDPGTATDVIVHLGNVMLALWAQPTGETVTSHEGRSVVSRPTTHAEHLRRAFEPIRRYGSADPLVLATLLRTLQTVRTETARRALPGPVAPIDELIRSIGDTADRAAWSESEIEEIDRLTTIEPS